MKNALFALGLVAALSSILTATSRPASAAAATMQRQSGMRGGGMRGAAGMRGGSRNPQLPKQANPGGRTAPGSGRSSLRNSINRAIDVFENGADSGALSQQTIDAYFLTSDYNVDGQISFREASRALSTSRTGFATYDRDRDGLINPDEFTDRYILILRQGGSFPQPTAAPRVTPPPSRSAERLRIAYDNDIDGALDAGEVDQVLSDYGRYELSSISVIRQLDANESSKIEFEELTGLVPLLFTQKNLEIFEETAEPQEGDEEETVSLAELFGVRTPRDSQTEAAPLPAQVRGPMDHFYRLDFDGDQNISFEDLNELLRPIQTTIRLKALVATLDTDGDGELSSEEFWASMED